MKQQAHEEEVRCRGGSKVVNAQDLLYFEAEFTAFLENLLEIGDKSVSLLKFLQVKDPKTEIFLQKTR